MAAKEVKLERTGWRDAKQATDGEVVLSDTVTLTRFKALAPGIVVPLAGKHE